MTRFLLCAIALAVGAIGSSANAADLAVSPMAVKAPVMAPPPANWTGFYIGANVGGGVADLPVYDKDDFFNAGGNFLSDKSGSWVGGFHGGYNMQFGSGVIGLEGDFSWAGFSASHAEPVVGCCDFYTASSKLDRFASVRVRAGLALDRTLIYVTAGPAWAHITGTWTESCFGDCGTTGVFATVNHDDWHTGIAVGAGAEFMVTQNWILRGEFLYLDFLEKSTPVVDTTCSSGCGTSNFGFSSTVAIGRVGLSYLFNPARM